MKKNKRLTILLIVFLLLLVVLGILYFLPIGERECPTTWIQHRGTNFFGFNGKELIPDEKYIEWVDLNCDIEPGEVSELRL